MLFGDVNARTANLPDYVLIDDFISKHFAFDDDFLNDYNVPVFLHDLDYSFNRSSKDPTTNTVGSKLLELCKNTNLFILNGRAGNDKNIGKFTFRDSTVIDYAIATLDCFKHFSFFDIVHIDIVDPIFSDGHSLLSLTINVAEENKTLRRNNRKTNFNNHNQPKWEESLGEEFNLNLNPEILIRIDNLLSQTSTSITKNDINEISDEIALLFQDSAKNTFPRKSVNNYFRSNKNKPWYGPQCNKARQRYNKARKKYNLNKSDLYKAELNGDSVYYEQIMNSFIRRHKSRNERKLRDLNFKRPRDYWKVLNTFKNNSTDKMPPIEDFYNHFKNANFEESHEHSEFLSFQYNQVEYDNECLNRPISEVEILRVISKCKNSKAASPFDNIYNEYIKISKHRMIPIYSSFFNKILNSEILPDAWLIGSI